MTKLILALLAGGALMLTTAIPVARADTSCTTTLTGTISGNVVVPPGSSCGLNAVTVTGSVTVDTGASLDVEGGSTVEGNVFADQCDFMRIGEVSAATITSVINSIHGNVSIQNCTSQSGFGFVIPHIHTPLTQIDGNLTCQGNSDGCLAAVFQVGGNMQVDNNPGGATVDLGSVSGNVQVDDNSGIAAVSGSIDGNSGIARVVGSSIVGNAQVNNNGPATVQTNTVNGNLTCQGNTSLTASGNTVHGTTHCSP